MNSVLSTVRSSRWRYDQITHVGLGVRHSFVRQEKIDDQGVSLLRGLVKRSVAGIGAAVDGCTGSQEEPHHSCLAKVRRHVQRRVTSLEEKKTCNFCGVGSFAIRAFRSNSGYSLLFSSGLPCSRRRSGTNDSRATTLHRVDERVFQGVLSMARIHQRSYSRRLCHSR